MAITFVGEAENSAANGGAITLTFPGGVAENDIVLSTGVMGTVTSGDIDMSQSAYLTSSTGYTDLAHEYADDTNNANLGVWYKRMGVTPDSTMVHDGFANSRNSTTGVLQIWRGVDTTTAIDQTTTTATGINSGIPDSPSITTQTDGALVVSCGASAGVNDTAITAPSGYTNQVDISQIESADSIAMMASKIVATAGAEDPAAWTNITDDVAFAWCAATVALRPSGAGGVALPVRLLALMGAGM